MADSYTTLGNFLLLKERAKGGGGTLWRAGEMERTGFKRIVWLRLFDQPGLDRNLMASGFASANQIAQTLKASNIVRNGVVGREKGIPFLAWDYVPSQPLDQLLERVAHEQFPIAIDNALLIAEKIAAALASSLAVEVGGEPLAHGFLLPHMVLIGNDGEAMVGGFGLAKGFLGNLTKAPTLKDAAAPYLAPEVLGGQPASRRSDVYSLGGILYQLLTGSALPADPALRAAALDAPQMAFDEGSVPQDVLGILRKALSGRPEERFASAAEFKRELEKLLYGGSYSPTTFNLALFMDRIYRNDIEQEDRELQKERSLDVAAYYQAPRSEAAEAPTSAKAPAPQSRTGLYVAIAGVVILGAVVAYLLLRPAPQQSVDPAAIRAMVESEFKQLKDKERALETQLQEERQRLAAAQEELLRNKQGAPGQKKLTVEEQRKLEEDIRARKDAAQRQEQELARMKAEVKAKEQQIIEKAPVVAVQPTAAPVLPTPAPQPTAAGAAVAMPVTAPTTAPPAPAAAAPTQAPAAPAPTVRAQPAVAGVLSGGPTENEFVEPTLVDALPEILQKPAPQFSRAVQMSRQPLVGMVILKAQVNAKGLVEDVQVLRPFSGPRIGIDEACVEAVRQCRFKPATKGGVKVKTWATITVPINIKK